MIARRFGGAALVAGSLAFVTVFSFLAATFGYPDVLDESAATVLPRLAAGGTPLRTAWLVYGAIPLTLLIGGLASMPLLERGGGRSLARVGGALAAVAALAMMVGLLRWPTLHWVLAERWQAATADQREVYGAVFDGANAYLGNTFGEYLGETMLAGWFIAMGIALRGFRRSSLGNGSVAAGVVALVAAQRQLTGIVEPVSDFNNLLLPVWLIVLGIVVWRDVKAPSSRSDMPWVSARSSA
ncbi:MAG TPA: DUF4386 family protein [Kofleriaceae bacterium]